MQIGSRAVAPVEHGFNTQLVYAFTLTTKKEKISSKTICAKW